MSDVSPNVWLLTEHFHLSAADEKQGALQLIMAKTTVHGEVSQEWLFLDNSPSTFGVYTY